MITKTQKDTSPLQKTVAKTAKLSSTALILCLFAAPATITNAHAPLVEKGAISIADQELMGDPINSSIAAEIETLFIDRTFAEKYKAELSDPVIQSVRKAYAQKVFQPLWTRDAAEQLMNLSDFREEHGLESAMTQQALRYIIDSRFSGTPRERAESDLRLSALWLTQTSDLSGGLADEGEMVKSTDARPTRSELIAGLHRAAAQDPIDAMHPFLPEAKQYGLLQSALEQYKMFAKAGAWKNIPDGDDMLEPGMTDPRVPALRKRLRSEGFATPIPFKWNFAYVESSFDAKSDEIYDDNLVLRVKSFQARHGLEQDGILGPSTLKALNESTESKINRIERAMNYWRHKDNLGERYIWVNIPSYRAEAWTGDRRDIAMKTIVGKTRTPTTAFSDEIEYVVVNPKWFLPIGLFKRQKLRKLRKDPGYAAHNNYVVYDRASGEELDPYAIDWNAPGVARKIQMVQTAGAHNALGQLKIIFPNKHSIYLHDTPSRHLFDRDVRALSSGCIRLHDPVKMANWLTDGDADISTTVFNATLDSGERDRFYLDQHVNVHLTYLPAVVNPEGRVEFPADVYQQFNGIELAKETYSDDIDREMDNINNIDNNEDRDLFVGVNGTDESDNLRRKALR
jgi:murein L,D-transpeptidase YcbB/YkuD